VEHGCTIADHSHIASGATVCGDCLIGEAVHVGAGATVIQGVKIGFGAVIAAGAVVTRNVEPLTLVAGVPARELRRTDDQELA
jgi:UDP-perosamine 4-acetyltransferase